MGLFKRKQEPPPPEDDERAPGWDAIERALQPVHGDVEPAHRALLPGVALGAPLQGISAYPAEGHWHFVTFGLTELFAKDSEEPEISGFGFELTMRVAREGEGGEPPGWPFNLLAAVAQQVQEGLDLAVGHRIQVGGPITGAAGCAQEAVAIVSDPSLPIWTKSPHGSFEFYQLVGVTPEELSEMQASSTAAVIERLAGSDRLLVTDPGRAA